MLKKPGLEELVRELEKDYARWEQVYMAGSKDPFWPDGVNANLCRNYILCGKKRIRELYPDCLLYTSAQGVTNLRTDTSDACAASAKSRAADPASTARPFPFRKYFASLYLANPFPCSAARSNPVSYTHLDVYKRQLRHKARNPGTGGRKYRGRTSD